MKETESERCSWCLKFDQYIKYHDEEWGVPVHEDQIHFEFLILEGAQAGLSWSTILKKREGYRKVFANFDPIKVAKFTDKKLEKILLDPSIVRNRLKVYAAVNNAKRFLEIQKEFGSFDKYIWSFVNHKPIQNRRKSLKEVPATTKESDLLSKDLIKRGFKFVGSTVIYAHMQACGLVNDHIESCFRYKEILSIS
ncbi:DNA-3-methyladenine glycosylase I [Leptospira kanakyensis]|uniref:DNA-3-methyladenine glycosylase I n=1 Tax=Leptospira kanakyensis TaxID=2484968 RepID=A0A6N4QL40_9LEPT|nr:DNA-3-methyladenine glycosylase I [Leptospira kanakyensis]MCW7482848.1 DNA-3-methyladenine glycosylase I [Leptospira kanakyensis]TGK55541.1 DNA-3-methyladenine glycosylase I [Leptospira kanakyensis]TGK61077.1 DNA-3-methyladenine glycosylase I [Leptospira kanakyensis]TGK76451.1 DNA-3-methyladenine glycosylase I [Leptospira kanakyensis]